jgi:hypothetical protein
MNYEKIGFSGPHFEGSLLDLAEALHYFDRVCVNQAIRVVFEGLGHCVDDTEKTRVAEHSAVHFD